MTSTPAPRGSRLLASKFMQQLDELPNGIQDEAATAALQFILTELRNRTLERRVRAVRHATPRTRARIRAVLNRVGV